MRIAFCNGKGGVGKTTISLIVCAALRRAGRDAVIYDADPQGTAERFCEILEIPLGKTGEIVIVDTAPRHDNAQTARLCREADRTIIVTTPSPAAMASTASSIEALRGQKTAILYNLIRHDGFASAPESITFDVPTLKATVRERTAYQRVLLEGWGALTPPAREEILAVALEVVTF